MKSYVYRDEVFTFEGAFSVQLGEDWVSPWRLDYDRLEFFPSLKDGIAHHCSGVRLCFSTDAKEVELNPWPREVPYRLDVFVDGKLHEEVTAAVGTDSIRLKKFAAGQKDIEIWLPNNMPFWLKGIGVPDEASIRKMEQKRKRWIHYGSSISHSGCAERPSNTWTGLVAKKMDLHLTSFGFSGNCQCEPMVARMIRDLPADIITLKLGINSYNAHTNRTWAACVIGLICLIREKHETTPIVVISPIYSPPREEPIGTCGYSLAGMRAELAGIVEQAEKYGDATISYVDGLDVFGPDELNFMPDELHPNSDGQFVMAEKFIKVMPGLR